MAIEDYYFEPHNDSGANDMEFVDKHTALLNEGKYTEATALLDENTYENGLRAKIYNVIVEKIRKFQLYLLNRTAPSNVLYSDTEPTLEEMGDKTIWRQPY